MLNLETVSLGYADLRYEEVRKTFSAYGLRRSVHHGFLSVKGAKPLVEVIKHSIF